ncbi:MAG TPA: 2Fe-2S iron-sulfur cluster-binding protein [Limnochordales bacterium]
MRLAIRRFDPATDPEPHWAVYEVELGPRQTVLDGLLRVADEQDPTLAFRRMCRSGICGACAAVVNGRPVLTCQTLCQAAAASPAPPDPGRPAAELVLEPLPHFRVLRDLVVDIQPFLEGLARLQAWLVPREDFSGVVPREQAERLWGVAPCVLCGICAAWGSPPGVGPWVDAATAHPAAVARALRMAADPRDLLGPARLSVFRELGLLAPHVARWLREVCPKGVDIEPLVQGLGLARGMEGARAS